MSAENQQCQGGPVSFTAIDLYEAMLRERDADRQRYQVKYSPVAWAAAEGYERARERAAENAKLKAAREV